MPPRIIRAHQFVRFSTKKQERGASRERQLELTSAMLNRWGWAATEAPLEDLGRSAWTGDHLKNGALGRFATRVRNGEIGEGDVLVTEKLDRLSRQEPLLALSWIQEMTSHGVAIATVEGDAIYTKESLNRDLLQVLQILVKAAAAADESNKRSERVRDAKDRRFAQAKEGKRIITRKCPGWLTPKSDLTGYIPNKERVDHLQLIYELAADGLGARGIARKLNLDGVTSWNGNGWSTSTVSFLLAHPAVSGDYVAGWTAGRSRRTKVERETIHGHFPSVLPADLIARARTAVNGRKLTGGRSAPTAANLFAGLLRCGCCGSRVHLRTAGEPPHKVLQCERASRRRGCTQNSTFRYAALEDTVLDYILEAAFDDRAFSRGDDVRSLTTHLAEAQKTLADTRGEIANLVKALGRLGDAPEVESAYQEARVRVSKLELDAQRLHLELTAARGAVSPEEHRARVQDIRKQMMEAPLAEREEARRRVREAVRALGVQGRCVVQDDGRRVVAIVFANGKIGIMIDCATGKVLAGIAQVAVAAFSKGPVLAK